MARTPLASPLTCGRGSARCSVALFVGGGWDVRIENDDGTVLTKHCSDWHRVERLRAQLESEWGDASTTARDVPSPGARDRVSPAIATPLTACGRPCAPSPVYTVPRRANTLLSRLFMPLRRPR
jgi:hypothetical protein